MADILSLIPTSILGALPFTVTGLLLLLVNALLAAVAIIISDKLVAHNIEIKHTLIMAVVALFATPLLSGMVFGFIQAPAWIAAYVLPLIVWLVLGEVLLSADVVTKLKVIVVAFVVYITLNIFVAPQLIALLPVF